MQFDTSGLTKLDTSGLKPLAPPRALDATGLKKLDTTGLKPLAPAQRAPVNPMSDDRSVPFGSLARGWNRLQQAGTMLQHQGGFLTDEEAAKALARDEADIASYPRPPAAEQGLREISEADGWADSAAAIIRNPQAILSVIGESLPQSLGPTVGGMVGGAAGSAVPAAGTTAGIVAGTGLGSFATEFSSTMLDTMREHGVDFNDSAAVTKALNDPALMDEARARGVRRGIPVATFDALSFGLAGTFSKMLNRGVGEVSRLRRGVGLAAEATAQAGFGAAGEAGAQVADKGTITNPGDVLMEGIAEIVTGAPEVAVGMARRGEEPAALPPVPQGALPAEQIIGADPEAPLDTAGLTPVSRETPATAPVPAPPVPSPTPQPAPVAVNPAALPGDWQQSGAAGRASEAYRYLTEQGISPQAAAAIVGHGVAESNLMVDAIGDGGTSEGILQWHNERRDALYRFAQQAGRDPMDWRTQLDFALHELRTSERRAGERLFAATSPEQAAEAMMFYERPQGFSDENPRAGHNWTGRLRNTLAVMGAAGFETGALPETVWTGHASRATPAGSNEGRPALDALLADDRKAADIRKDAEASAAFEPTQDWQPAPRDADLRGLQTRTTGDVTEARLAPQDGSRSAPIVIENPADATYAAEQTVQPTPAQAEAGNYRKRHVKWNGMDIAIETEAGGERTGVDPDGKPWAVRMPAPYGYIKRTSGADGDQIDVYLGSDNTDQVFVVDQIDPRSSKFDEHKVMLGFRDLPAALDAYEAAFSDGSGGSRAGAVTPMSVPQFRQWVHNGNPKEPLAWKKPRATSGRRSGPQYLDLVQFLASRGGLQDYQGELAALDLHKVFVPGYGRLVRAGGHRIDMAREAAEEAGYIGRAGQYQVTTVAELLNAIDETRRGNRVFSREDLAQGAGERAEKVSHSRHKAVEAELKQTLAAVGANLRPEEIDEVMALIAEGWWPEEAAVEVMDRHALAGEAETDQTTTVEDSADDIPFLAKPDPGRAAAESEAAAPTRLDTTGLVRRPAEGTPPAREQHGSGEPADGTGGGAGHGERAGSSPAERQPEVAAPATVSATSPASETATVAVLTGDELGIDFKGRNDMPALRQAAAAWYDANLRGTTATMADGTVVSFNRRGRNKTVSSGKGDVLLRSVPAIKPIIEGGKVVLREPGNRDDVVERLVIAAPVQFAGATKHLAVSVHRTRDGTVHYDFTFDRDEGEAVGTRPRIDRGGPPDDSSSGPLPSLEVPLQRSDTLNLVEWAPVDKESANPRLITERFRQDGQDASTEILLADPFVEAVGRIEAAMRHELDRLGLPDVGVRLANTIRFIVNGQAYPADGRYFKGLIDVALDADNPANVLQHEALHALRRAGVFMPEEWTVLANTSRRNWMERYGIPERYAGFPAWAQEEEGVAHAYADWATGKMKVSGLTARAFSKIRNFMEALRNVLKGLGFQSAEDVFDKVASGRVGARQRRGGSDEVAYAVPSMDGDLFASDVIETADGPRLVSEAFRVAGIPGHRYVGHDSDSTNYVIYDDSRVQIEEMFKLRKAPHTAEESQQAMQGFIARGQPLDRALRLPFQIFGGIDQHGQWKPGLYLTDKAGKLLTESTFNPKGRFAWLNGPLATARAGLVDRYGLEASYVERERNRVLDERRIMMAGVEVLKSLKDQNIGLQEAKVLQAILTGEAVDDAAMQALAVPIRQAIDELGREAVSLGLLSPESYARNRGAYLHRVYMKHEADQSALSRFAGRIMGRSRKKIIGDQFKGRGIFLDVDSSRLTRDDPEWAEARRGKPVRGEKFRILDLVQPQEDMLDAERKPRALRRVFWPADREVPLKYADWTDHGVWEVRGEKPGGYVLWRDYTKAERSNMGEILDARYTIGRTYMMMAHDLATGRFYKDIAENEQWTSTREPAARWVDAADASRFWSDPEVAWVRVPETAIPQSGGKKRWGALAGKWVRAEIWRDLNEIEVMSRPNVWRQLLTQWKLNKTARSPVVHMNNIMSNVMFMDMADIRMQDLTAGLRAFVKGTKDYQEAFEHGAFGADMMTQEVRDNILKPLLDEIAKAEKDGEADSFMSRSRMMGRFAERIWGWAKFADRKMLEAYRIEDEIFRMATYMRRRQMGDDPATAADFARQQFLDYDIRAPWVNAARNTVLPFISYTYRAAPLVARAIATRPWKLPKYFLIAYMLNALAYGWDDEGDEEERERASLRDEERGHTWIGTPRMMRMPFRNEYGMPVFLDIRRWIPAGDIFDTNQGSSALPIPAPIQFGGPLMMGAELALNKQGFTGEPITNDLTDTWWEKAGKVGDYAWKSWMPSAAWVPGSWYWTKLGNALKGATDTKGRPYDPATALLSSFGIKVKPQDVEEGLYWRGFDLRKVEQELKAQARRLGRQRERNLVSQREFEREMAEIMGKMDRLRDQRAEIAEAANGDDEE